MLKKLLKYDLKWNYKMLIIFYLIAIISALLSRVFGSIENSFIFFIISEVFKGITISMVVNIIINNMMRLWVRLINNCYKDESYLTHTLPIKKQTILLSKILSAIITMVTSVAVIIISLLLCYYSKENIEFIKNIMLTVIPSNNGEIIKFIIIIGLTLFLEFLFAIITGYLAIILAHKSNNLKIVKSIILGFILFMFPSMTTLIIVFIAGLFNPQIMALFNEISGFDIEVIKSVLYIGITSYIIYITTFCLIANKQFKKGVNVD